MSRMKSKDAIHHNSKQLPCPHLDGHIVHKRPVALRRFDMVAEVRKREHRSLGDHVDSG